MTVQRPRGAYVTGGRLATRLLGEFWIVLEESGIRRVLLLDLGLGDGIDRRRLLDLPLSRSGDTDVPVGSFTLADAIAFLC